MTSTSPVTRAFCRAATIADFLGAPFAVALGVRDEPVRELADVVARDHRRERQVPVRQRRAERALPVRREPPEHFIRMSWFCECHFYSPFHR